MDRVCNCLIIGLLCLGVAACNRPSAVPSLSAQTTAATGHQNTDTVATQVMLGTNVIGRTRFSWGPEDALAELVLDRKTEIATLTLLKNDGVTPLAISLKMINLTIDAPLTEIELVAKPRETDPAGTASQFEAVHEVLRLTKPLSGTLSGFIAEEPFVTDFSEPYDLFAATSE
jgi:hypothetical protein